MRPRMPMMIGFRMVSSKCLANHILKTIELRSIYMITINGRQGSPDHMSCKNYFTIRMFHYTFFIQEAAWNLHDPLWGSMVINVPHFTGCQHQRSVWKWGMPRNTTWFSWGHAWLDFYIHAQKLWSVSNYDVQRSEIHVAKTDIGHRNDQHWYDWTCWHFYFWFYPLG